MRKSLGYLASLIAVSLISLTGFTQVSTINGNVRNSSTNENVAAVSITVKGSGSGTYTDDKGNFRLNVNKSLPLTLVVSSVGYDIQEIRVTNASEFVQVDFKPGSTLGQEVVISATRTPSRILESPVTIERISSANIRNSASPQYYDIIRNLKGVDVVTSSLTFKTPSTRGFNGSGNLRLNQIVDGMDNQAPGLNFSVGAVIGLTELDVESVELLPGASSALYGPGGMNGAIIINSKDPFKYQGLSFDVKTGIMHTDYKERSPSPYYNWSLRWAKKVSDKFAFKIGAELIQAKDWVANDYRNYSRVGTAGNVIPGTRETDPNYDGINVYGDETTVDIRSNILNPLAVAAPFYAPYVNALPASIRVSRTGYKESEVVDPNTVNVKLSGSANYRITDKTTLILEGYWGSGNTVYTGSDRYSLKNLKVGQYKLELNNPNWFLRAYTTQEDAGESFNATVTTRLFNEAWKPSGGTTGWYYQYALTFLQNKLAGLSDIAAHNAARAVADVGRPASGSALFNQYFDQVRKIPIVKGGGLFVDKTNLYNVEGQYNLTPYTQQYADVIVGANYKRYVLNSEGTLFADSAGKIGINEVGVYAQATKHLLSDRLKLIVSGRYDKNQNFDGKFTPRISAVIRVAPDNNVRLSYQSAYRFASTQQQWINLSVAGGTRLLGGLQTFKDYYNFSSNPVYAIDSNLFAGNPQVQKFNKFKAETLNSFEAGYKGLLLNKKLLIDMYGYYGIYKNFIARVQVAQSVSGNISVLNNPATVRANLTNNALVKTYSVPTNVAGDVKTYGFGISLDYSLPYNFTIGANVTSDKLNDVPAGFVAAFNAPLYRVGASLGNTGFGHKKRMGFNFTYRWQDTVDYQGDFSNGIVPAFHTLDGQVNYKFPEQKVMIKLGSSNLLNQYYRDGFGNAAIGGVYYLSIGYNL
ncbi:MAG: TonB-dependent receptor [Chitinophagaceae bacterium]|nr:TonB-dependent receptor [Chitinophagaceae bacterium]